MMTPAAPALGQPLADALLDLPLALSDDSTRRLRDFSGQWVVLYFYPKDATPGCTSEGLDFNALLPQLRAANATVLGVSRDSLRAHKNFIAKQGFEFALISDSDEALCRGFDVIRLKKNYGREYFGIERSTFLISPAQILHTQWRNIKVAGHAQAVYQALLAAQSTAS